MVWEEKMPIFEVSEFPILPYTQNRKLKNLGKFSFTWEEEMPISEVSKFSILPYTLKS